ncbi:hypothetical protein D3C78_1894250 [compost metagenome]
MTVERSSAVVLVLTILMRGAIELLEAAVLPLYIWILKLPAGDAPAGVSATALEFVEPAALDATTR